MNEVAQQAFDDFRAGMKYREIAEKYGVSLSAVKSWATRYWKTGGCSQKEKRLQPERKKVATKRGGQPGNKNAVGHGGTGPPGNRNAETHGLFTKYLPDETLSIIQQMPRSPLDILWDQIQIAYAAIIRAQKIMYVKDQSDSTTTPVQEKNGDTVTEERWEVQQAWDKHGNFLQAQARAQKTLEGMINRYEDLLHKNWELATEEQKLRIAQMRATLDEGDSNTADDGFLDALSGTAAGDWADEES